MNTTLRLLREFRILLGFVAGFTICCVVVMYWGVFSFLISDLFKSDMAAVASMSHQVAHIAKSKVQEVSAEAHPSYSLEHSLQHTLEKTKLSFNMLPPGHWIMVDTLGIKAPIIDVAYADKVKLDKGDFYKELEQGVVKYPYTADPGQKGNSVLFGHSSVEIWDKGKYGNVFQKLSKLPVGEKIKVIWDGTLFEYDVDHKEVKWPKDVPGTINEWKNGEYLTLMACYPLFSDAQRILIRAKRLGSNTQLALGGVTKIAN